MKRALSATAATRRALSSSAPMAARSPPCSSALLRVLALALAAFAVIPGNLAFVATTTCGRPTSTTTRLPQGSSSSSSSSMLLGGKREGCCTGRAGATACNWGKGRREAVTGLGMGAGEEVPHGDGGEGAKGAGRPTVMLRRAVEAMHHSRIPNDHDMARRTHASARFETL